MKTVRIVTLAVFCALAGVASASDDVASANAKAEIRKTIQGCAQGLERLLPGDYYFCAAARDIGYGHDSRGRERLRDAAHWASKPAQYVLGLMYFNGDEGPANRPLGIAWLALAAERHDPRFEPSFVEAYQRASPAEREQANAYWQELKEDFADTTAGVRARRRYLAEMRNIEAASMFGGDVFIDGITPPSGPAADGVFNGPGGGVGNRTSSQHGFAVTRTFQKAGDTFFRGMVGTVTVGEVQGNLIPIGQTVARAPVPTAN
ncbi:MAG: SEL1-like repeat protein [Luteibacter sp.]